MDKNLIVKGVIVLLLVIGIGLSGVVLTSCISSPRKSNYSTDDCFMFSDCLYRIRAMKDKSECVTLAEACRDSLKELRTYKRIDFCKTTGIDGLSASECRLYLNQK
jgi:hypothetical protein